MKEYGRFDDEHMEYVVSEPIGFMHMEAIHVMSYGITVRGGRHER